MDELKGMLKSAVARGDAFAEQLSRAKEDLAATIDKANEDLIQAHTSHEVRMAPFAWRWACRLYCCSAEILLQANVSGIRAEHESNVNQLMEEHMSQMQLFQSEFQSAKYVSCVFLMIRCCFHTFACPLFSFSGTCSKRTKRSWRSGSKSWRSSTRTGRCFCVVLPVVLTTKCL